MRISDWSSDVCSSDLLDCVAAPRLAMTEAALQAEIRPGVPNERAPFHRTPGSRSGTCHRNQQGARNLARGRSEEHTSELQSLMRISYAVFCLKKKIQKPRSSD